MMMTQIVFEPVDMAAAKMKRLMFYAIGQCRHLLAKKYICLEDLLSCLFVATIIFALSAHYLNYRAINSMQYSQVRREALQG